MKEKTADEITANEIEKMLKTLKELEEYSPSIKETHRIYLNSDKYKKDFEREGYEVTITKYLPKDVGVMFAKKVRIGWYE